MSLKSVIAREVQQLYYGRDHRHTQVSQWELEEVIEQAIIRYHENRLTVGQCRKAMAAHSSPWIDLGGEAGTA